MTLPYAEISPWLTEPANLRPPLTQDTRADVAIVGGGYTGLSTALALREAGVDVVVLEQGFAGSGASGRNAGHLTPTIGKDLPTLLLMFGKERASALVRFADDAVEHAEHLIQRHQIDCDYTPNGNIMAAAHPKHEERLRKAAETSASLGGEVEFLSGAQLRERGFPTAFYCGVLERRGGVLHPGRYVLGLRAAAIRAGVRLYEKTTVSNIAEGKPVRVRCAEGTVTTDHAVVATNAYTAQLGFRKRAVAPLRVSLFETAPLTEAQLAAIDWRGREGIYTSHEILESYQRTAHNTIVGGSKFVRYKYGNGLSPGYDEQAFQIIERAFRQRFPQLQEIPIAHFWGGWIGFTTDFLPTLGSLGDHNNLHYGYGFAGHGVAQASYMGALLSERIQGRTHPAEAALQRRLFNWPPEPLRWLAAQALLGVFTQMDKRTDRQVMRLMAASQRAPASLTSGSRA